MSEHKFHKIKLSIITISVTIITSTVCYYSYKPNAYEVYVNGRSVAYVSNKDKVEDINKEITNDFSKRFTNIKANNNVNFDMIISKKSALSDDSMLKENMLKAMKIQVAAVEMKIDGNTIGILANEQEGKNVISAVGEKYLSEINLNDKKFNGIKNSVKYITKEVDASNVNSIEEAILNLNELSVKNKKFSLLLEVTGIVTIKEPVNYTTIISWSNSLAKGESKINSKGENGVKLIEKQITMINEKVGNEKVIKETILEKPKDEIILKGTKVNEVPSLAMVVTSRGSISSNFGMRWGKMHEGIDIATAIGTPIYAALSGKIIYAGWEEGYGNVIKISHSEGIETIYGHCSEIKAKINQIVNQGELIGYTGNTGRSTGPHLHFEVRKNGKAENPAPFIYKTTET